MGSKGSSSSTVDPRAWEAQNKLADISEKSFYEGEPVRTALMGKTQGLMEGSYDITTDPMYKALYGASAAGIENAYRSNVSNLYDEYGTARNSILSSIPSGGQLYSALAQTELERAKGASDLLYNKDTSLNTSADTILSGLTSDLLNLGTSGAYGSQASGLSGLSSASDISSNLASAQLAANTSASNSKNSTLGSLGTGLGLMIGLGSSGGLSSLGTKAGTTAASSLGSGLTFGSVPTNYFSNSLWSAFK
jgi:hypothetical protein